MEIMFVRWRICQEIQFSIIRICVHVSFETSCNENYNFFPVLDARILHPYSCAVLTEAIHFGTRFGAGATL